MTIGKGKHAITLNTISCGKDISVSIYGGDIPHIGAVAVAVPRESLSGDGSISSSASVICLSGHKEDDIARKVALRISAAWNCTASVSVGIHIDKAKLIDFIEIEKNVDLLVDELLKEQIIVVDESDNELGSIGKMEAHYNGILHRAFSILVFNEQNQLLLQRRSFKKYHTPGLWTNTCCSHPRYGEKLTDAVQRRLIEEMGFSCALEELFHFIYKVEFEKGLFEYELDHVFLGRYSGNVIANPDEVHEIKWIDLDTLKREIEENPDQFTYWFKYLLKHHSDTIHKYLEA
ncbi:isopentenyl-diphosphate Delta-isomerase [Fusibacter bizertensis]